MTKDLDNLTIVNVRFENEKVIFDLSDGGLIGCSVAWFSWLKNATQKQRNHWKLIDRNQGVKWIDLEDILSLKGMFYFSPKQ